ncbi:MAG: RnfABCDGE type electron transport complex subunit B [Bacillota bacterium]|jgi:electron transport complex protein RnfB
MVEATLFLGGAGLVMGVLLGVAAKKFRVEEDPRIEAVLACLPGANCGACGFPGCSGLAMAICEGKAPVNACSVGGNAVAERISEILGTTAEALEPQVAVVHCQGASEEVAAYRGIRDCEALNMLGGSKLCPYGCLSLGSCVSACPFGAMSMGDNGLPVVDVTKCTGCGICVKTCPRGVIDLAPFNQEVDVRCHSHDRGATVRKYCKAGCIGCALCVKSCPEKCRFMEGGTLAKIDYAACKNCGVCVAKCPVKAISRMSRKVDAAL